MWHPPGMSEPLVTYAPCFIGGAVVAAALAALVRRLWVGWCDPGDFLP